MRNKNKYFFSILCALFSFFIVAFNNFVLAENVHMNNLRLNADAEKVRIVADLGAEVDYKSFMLKDPQRVVINLSNATLGKDVKKEYEVNSPYVKKVRLGQFDKNTIRIVVETNIKEQGYDVFSLKSDANYRVVMDFGNVTFSNKNTLGNIEKINKVEKIDKKDKKIKETKEIKKIELNKNNQSPKPKTPIVLPKIELKPILGAEILKGKKITIDPGHGGSDSGAIGPNGIMEKDVAFKIAMNVAQRLKDAGARVFLTRKGDNDVAKNLPASDVEELQARVDVANESESDAFLSIHLDAFTSPKAQGTSGWHYVDGSDESKILADSIKKRVVENLKTVDRGTKSSNFYVVKHTTMPATLLEVAFLSNPEEEQMINSAEGINKASQGIFQGFIDFFNKTK